MRWLRWRRRETDDFAEAIRPELHALSSRAPVARRELLERIVASRVSGTRVILPDARGVVPRSRARFLIPAALVAAALVLVLPFRRTAPPAPIGEDSSGFGRLATEWLPASVALAQTDVGSTRATLRPMELTSTDRLRPMTLAYVRTWRDSAGKELRRLNSAVSLQATAGDGVAAWQIVSRNDGTVDGRRVLAIDSVLVARADLRLLRRSVLQTPYSRYDEIRISQHFHGDSITGRMHAKGADASPEGRPIARRLPSNGGPYIVDGMPPFVLGAVSLHPGWSGRASSIGWAVRDYDVLYPVELRVEGEEVVTVPAGQFDCWRMSIRFPRRTVEFWVRKADGVAVQSFERDASGGTRALGLVEMR